MSSHYGNNNNQRQSGRNYNDWRSSSSGQQHNARGSGGWRNSNNRGHHGSRQQRREHPYVHPQQQQQGRQWRWDENNNRRPDNPYYGNNYQYQNDSQGWRRPTGNPPEDEKKHLNAVKDYAGREGPTAPSQHQQNFRMNKAETSLKHEAQYANVTIKKETDDTEGKIIKMETDDDAQDNSHGKADSAAVPPPPKKEEEEEEAKPIAVKIEMKDDDTDKEEREKMEMERIRKMWPVGVTEEHIPPMDFPPGWNQRKENAITETSRFIHTEIFVSDDDDDDDSSSDNSDNYMYNDRNLGRDNPYETKIKEYDEYLGKLQDCSPLTWGFHAINLHPDNERCCYCPCGNQMKQWRQGNQVRVDCCGAKSKFTPEALLAHLKQKAGMGNNRGINDNCHYHLITYRYLKSLFKDYINPGVDHKAFYHNGTSGHKKALASENKKTHEVLQKVKRDLEEERKKVEELEEAKNKMKRLEEVNEELYKELQAIKELKEKINIKEEEEESEKKMGKDGGEKALEALSEEKIHLYKEQCCSFYKVSRQFLAELSGASTNARIEFQVPNQLSLQIVFDEWKVLNDKDDKACLFRSLDFKKKKHFHSQKLLIPWRVSFEGSEGVEELSNRVKVKQESKGNDLGGLSREFFSQVWRQMGNLNAKIEFDNNNINIPLFQASKRGGLAPTTDEVFKECIGKEIDKEYREKGETPDETKKKKEVSKIFCSCVKPYYVAIGRVIIQCISTDDMIKTGKELGERAGNTIADHVIPLLYRNHLFRGIDPLDESYPLGKLIDHAFALFDQNSKGVDEAHEFLSYIDDGEDDEGGERKDKKYLVRKKIHEQFIVGRSYALSALKEGLTLNGIVNLPLCFRLMPLEAIGKIAFSKSVITAEDINSVLQPMQAIDDGPEMKHFDVQQKLILVMKELFKEKEYTDPDFLRRFVSFCSGRLYLPDKSCHEVKLKIVFDSTQKPDSLPGAQTCTNTLYLPATAYEGQKEQFEEKMSKSMELCAGGFDMK